MASRFCFPSRSQHLSTGIQASGRAMSVLTAFGRTDLAYALLTDTRFPSWGYMLTVGNANFQETTIPEHWGAYVADPLGGYQGGDNSFNHYALGAVGEWIYRVVGGINPDDNNPGYKNTIINPIPGGGITNAAATYNSIRGPIATAWSTNAGAFSLAVTIPANATATVTLPCNNPARITESGGGSTNAPGVFNYYTNSGTTVFQLGSGSYNFTAGP